MSHQIHNRQTLPQKVVRSLLVTSAALIVAVTVTGCDLADNHLKMDRSAHAEFQDYRDSLASRVEQDADARKAAEVASADDQGIPSFQPYMASPSENLRPMPLVSVSVNQTIPLRDVLYDLADQADYDIELDPRISGAIIFTARDRPFDTVIERISEIAGLRYKFEDDSVRVELDTAYNKTYKIDYLSYIRKNKSTISNDVAVKTGEGANTGSGFTASGESESNFWGELETGLTQILGGAAGQGGLKTNADPQVTAVDPVAAPVEPVVAQPADGTNPDGSAAPTVQVQAPQATLQVQPLPSVDPNSVTQATGDDSKAGFALNKGAGMITVFATDRQHKEVEEYLTELRRSSTAQVLIEAKVLEVTLTDEFATGIEWSAIDIGEFGVQLTQSGALSRPGLSPETTVTNIRIGYTGNDIQSLIDAVSRFGTVKALSSPRMTVLNNQSAVLNVATNQVYFEVDIDITQTDAGTQTQVDSDIRNVPEGVLINVQPSINLVDRTISMAVRPTVTKIVDFEEDPAVTFAVAAAGLTTPITSEVPVVNVQEVDSLVKLSSGQTIVMGGLIQDRTDSEQKGVPVLSEIPLFGAAFRNQGDKVQKTELVIFLKATIVDADGQTITPADRDIYRKFSEDRRPLGL